MNRLTPTPTCRSSFSFLLFFFSFFFLLLLVVLLLVFFFFFRSLFSFLFLLLILLVHNDIENNTAISSRQADFQFQAPTHANSVRQRLKRYPMTPARRCTGCTEDISRAKVARSHCSHNYCSSCLERCFKSSLTEGGRFPPRCCGRPYDIATVGKHLTPETLRQYEKKKVEFETPNKVYCSRGRCSAFIPSTWIANNTANCPNCGHQTCAVCKEPFHTGFCSQNTDYNRQMSAARKYGWQTCPHCRRLVERHSGCQHVALVRTSLSSPSFFPRLRY